MNQASLFTVTVLTFTWTLSIATQSQAATCDEPSKTHDTPVVSEETGTKEETLFGNVVRALSERYYDESFRQDVLPDWVRLYEDRAASAKSFEAHRDVVQEFLSNIPASHLGLISARSHQRMMDELGGVSAPSFGLELIEYDGKHYAHNVLEKGPADVAGIRRGDRIISIDGQLVDDSPRLDWRTDDAFLPDPPVRYLTGTQGDTLKLRVERTPGKYLNIDLPCENYSAWQATQASARVIEQDGKRIGVIHFWMIQLRGPDALLKEKLEGEFASCDALVLDLRGRGGSGFMVKRMLDVLEGVTSTWDKPIAALINEHSRSAKEVIAQEFRKRDLGSLVGERTAGAVIPASMTDVGFDMHLMFPTFTLPEHTESLEFQGVAPDVLVAEVGPYSAGADPIFEAGLAEAVRLAGSAEWKQRRQEKTAAASSASNNSETPGSAGSPAVASSHSATSSQGSKKLAESLSIEDPAGHDPRAIEILDKMVNALGGERAIRSHTAKTIQGKRNIGGMIEGTFTSLHAVPNLFIQRTELPGMGRMEVGYNGTIGWQVAPHSGTQAMSEEDQAEIVVDADFYADLNLQKNNPSIVYVGLTQFSDKQCHEIRLTDTNGKVQLQYIDTSSYLPIGSVGEVKTNMGPMIMTSVVKEFKDFDGEMIPVRTEQDVGGMQDMTTTITNVSFAPHAEHTFDPPKEVVAGLDE